MFVFSCILMYLRNVLQLKTNSTKSLVGQLNEAGDTFPVVISDKVIGEQIVMPLINAVWYISGNMDILVTEVDFFVLNNSVNKIKMLMYVKVFSICFTHKKRVLVSKKKKEKKSLPTYPTLKVRVGERGNKHVFNCSLIHFFFV